MVEIFSVLYILLAIFPPFAYDDTACFDFIQRMISQCLQLYEPNSLQFIYVPDLLEVEPFTAGTEIAGCAVSKS